MPVPGIGSYFPPPTARNWVAVCSSTRMLKPLHKSPRGLPMYFFQRIVPKIVGGNAIRSSIDTVSNACIIVSPHADENISLQTIRQQDIVIGQKYIGKTGSVIHHSPLPNRARTRMI